MFSEFLHITNDIQTFEFDSICCINASRQDCLWIFQQNSATHQTKFERILANRNTKNMMWTIYGFSALHPNESFFWTAWFIFFSHTMCQINMPKPKLWASKGACGIVVISTGHNESSMTPIWNRNGFTAKSTWRFHVQVWATSSKRKCPNKGFQGNIIKRRDPRESYQPKVSKRAFPKGRYRTKVRTCAS